GNLVVDDLPDEGAAQPTCGVVFRQTAEQVQRQFLLHILSIGFCKPHPSDQPLRLVLDEPSSVLVDSVAAFGDVHLSLLEAGEGLVWTSTNVGNAAWNEASGGVVS